MRKLFGHYFGMIFVSLILASCGANQRWSHQAGDLEGSKGNLQVIKVLNAPGREISALAWSGKDLWCADAGTRSFYRFDQEGRAERMFEPLPEHGAPFGMAWVGGYIWMTSTEPENLYKYNYQGLWIRTFEAPVPKPRGLAWDRTYLWMVDSEAGVLWRTLIAGSRFKTEEKIRDEETPLEGVAWAGEFLWVCSPPQNRIIKLDPGSGKLIASFAGPGSRPVRLAWDGEALWVADIGTGKIYQVTVPSEMK